jgi:hypothetical protein
MDLPFDEIYHREKSLIDRVANLESDLSQAIQLQKPIFEFLGAPIDKVFEGHEEEYESDIEHFESHSEKDALGQFSVRSGIKIRSTEEREFAKLMMKQNSLINEGYCFLTFSHTDEAKRAIIRSEELYILDCQIEVFLKNEIDHGDFDLEYVRGRMKADAKLLEMREDLKDAKEELAEYEHTFSDHMPNLK